MQPSFFSQAAYFGYHAALHLHGMQTLQQWHVSCSKPRTWESTSLRAWSVAYSLLFSPWEELARSIEWIAQNGGGPFPEKIGTQHMHQNSLPLAHL